MGHRKKVAVVTIRAVQGTSTTNTNVSNTTTTVFPTIVKQMTIVVVDPVVQKDPKKVLAVRVTKIIQKIAVVVNWVLLIARRVRETVRVNVRVVPPDVVCARKRRFTTKK